MADPVMLTVKQWLTDPGNTLIPPDDANPPTGLQPWLLRGTLPVTGTQIGLPQWNRSNPAPLPTKTLFGRPKGSTSGV